MNEDPNKKGCAMCAMYRGDVPPGFRCEYCGTHVIPPEPVRPPCGK